jgi:hypothetical protein
MKYLIEKYLGESNIWQKRKEEAWGKALVDIVYTYEDKGFWLMIGKHKPSKKYYGVNSSDDVIDLVSKQKVIKWAKTNGGLGDKINIKLEEEKYLGLAQINEAKK